MIDHAKLRLGLAHIANAATLHDISQSRVRSGDMRRAEYLRRAGDRLLDAGLALLRDVLDDVRPMPRAEMPTVGECEALASVFQHKALLGQVRP